MFLNLNLRKESFQIIISKKIENDFLYDFLLFINNDVLFEKSLNNIDNTKSIYYSFQKKCFINYIDNYGFVLKINFETFSISEIQDSCLEMIAMMYSIILKDEYLDYEYNIDNRNIENGIYPIYLYDIFEQQYVFSNILENILSKKINSSHKMVFKYLLKIMDDYVKFFYEKEISFEYVEDIENIKHLQGEIAIANDCIKKGLV